LENSLTVAVPGSRPPFVGEPHLGKDAPLEHFYAAAFRQMEFHSLQGSINNFSSPAERQLEKKTSNIDIRLVVAHNSPPRGVTRALRERSSGL
jgi:hypothetical protein